MHNQIHCLRIVTNPTATNAKGLQQNIRTCSCLPVFLAEPKAASPNMHRILITETDEKKLKVQHDDKDVIVEVTTPPPPQKIKTTKCTKCYVCWVRSELFGLCFLICNREYFKFMSQTISHRDTHITIVFIYFSNPQGE
jgi:hypothetical protein